MSSPEKPQILLVEDEARVAAFVIQGLSEEGYEVEWIGDGTRALARAREVGFDLLLLDVRLPGLSGVEICRRLRQHGATIPILMLTALDAVEDRVAGLRAGADDYLPKPFAFDELLARIEALLRRVKRLPVTQTYEDGPLLLDPLARTATYDDTTLTLTQKEFDLLAYFMGRAGQALSRDDIHRDVWGHDFDRGTNLIDVYVGYVRHKLEEVGSTSRIETVRGVGYRYVTHGNRADGDG